MSVWPRSGRVTPPLVTFCFSDEIRSWVATSTTSTWATANQCRFWPVYIPEPFTATALWWHNGGTATGNVDCGLYTLDGNLIVSTGSTAQTGTDQIQSVDITDTFIPDGLIYIGMVCSSASATVGNLGAVSTSSLGLGVFIQASTFPLPTTATWATAGATGFRIYKCGALKFPRTVV